MPALCAATQPVAAREGMEGETPKVVQVGGPTDLITQAASAAAGKAVRGYKVNRALSSAMALPVFREVSEVEEAAGAVDLTSLQAGREGSAAVQVDREDAPGRYKVAAVVVVPAWGERSSTTEARSPFRIAH